MIYSQEHIDTNHASQNALRQALSGHVNVMNEEERIAFNKFSADLIASLDPRNALEMQLAMRIAKDSWRLNRVSAIEDNIYAIGQSKYSDEIETRHPEIRAAFATALTFSAETKRFELLTLYEQRTSRTLQKNLAVLRDLQSTRHLRIKTKQPAENGLVYANNEIAAAAGTSGASSSDATGYSGDPAATADIPSI